MTSPQTDGGRGVMKRRARKLLAGLAVVGGVGLIVLERSAILGGGAAGVSWFWIAVAVVLALLGLAELVDKGAGG